MSDDGVFQVPIKVIYKVDVQVTILKPVGVDITEEFLRDVAQHWLDTGCNVPGIECRWPDWMKIPAWGDGHGNSQEGR